MTWPLVLCSPKVLFKPQELREKEKEHLREELKQEADRADSQVDWEVDVFGRLDYAKVLRLTVDYLKTTYIRDVKPFW